MKRDQNSFLVAEVEGRIVGSVLVTHDGRKGWINRLAVHREYRRRGIGGALVSEAENWLIEQGIGIFACLIEGDNPLSAEVLEKLGLSDQDMVALAEALESERSQVEDFLEVLS